MSSWTVASQIVRGGRAESIKILPLCLPRKQDTAIAGFGSSCRRNRSGRALCRTW